MIEKGFVGWKPLGILYKALGIAVHSNSASVFRTVEQIAEFSQTFRVRLPGDIYHASETAWNTGLQLAVHSR